MKKKSIFIAFIGILLIIAGVVLYKLNIFEEGNKTPSSNKPTPSSTIEPSINNDDNDEEENIIINYSGKYYDGNKKIDIIQVNDYYLYFYTTDKIIGKAKIDNNHATGEYNHQTIEITISSDVITIESNDANITGSYTKKNDLSLEEFYALTCGNINLFHSNYNGAHYGDNTKIISYQMNDNEVGVFIEKDNIKEFIIFKITDNNTLTGTYNGHNYTITVSTKYGGEMLFSENNNEQETLSFMGEVGENQIFDLYIEYNK